MGGGPGPVEGVKLEVWNFLCEFRGIKWNGKTPRANHILKIPFLWTGLVFISVHQCSSVFWKHVADGVFCWCLVVIFLSSHPTSNTSPTEDAKQLTGLSRAKQLRCKAECGFTEKICSLTHLRNKICVYGFYGEWTEFQVGFIIVVILRDPHEQHEQRHNKGSWFHND